MSTKPTEISGFLSVIKDTTKTPRSRAEFLLLAAGEVGLDLVAPVAALIERQDKTAELEKSSALLRAKLEEFEARKSQPCQPEVFLRKLTVADKPQALVISQGGPLVCPADVDLDGIRCGDFVLIDRSSGSIVARDGEIVPTGQIARVEEIPEDLDGMVIVSLRDQRATAYVSEAARRSGRLQPGAEVVFDSNRQIIYRVLALKVDGSDLLSSPAELSGFTIADLGDPSPVIGKILRQIERCIAGSDWEQSMRARRRRSYLFWGPTGTGKTATIKVIVNLIADRIEALTGVREPRVVFCDASDFYSPYLGESEHRITSWFEKLGALARREISTRDGRSIRMPLVVVFEEIEGLVRQRGEYGGSSHLFDRLLSMILMKMDDVTNSLDAPIIFISTTNKKSLADFAARRRFCEREIRFGTLGARSALAVLEKKIPVDLPVRAGAGGNREGARQRLLRTVIHYLFGNGEDQAVAEVTLRDNSRRRVERRDLITGALLEMALSQATDEALDRAAECGKLAGLEAEAVIGALTDQFEAIATSMKPHNIMDYAPHLFEGDDLLVADVRPSRRPGRPAIHFIGASSGAVPAAER